MLTTLYNFSSFKGEESVFQRAQIIKWGVLFEGLGILLVTGAVHNLRRLCVFVFSFGTIEMDEAACALRASGGSVKIYGLLQNGGNFCLRIPVIYIY